MGSPTSWPLLFVVVFLPLIGAAFVALARGDDEILARNVRNVAILSSLCTLATALLIWAQFDAGKASFQMVENYRWLPGFSISFKLGIDGFSLFFVVLTTFLAFLCILWRWSDVKNSPKKYIIILLTLETMVVGTFLSIDMVSFYVFFEGMLIPLFFLIGIFGDNQRSFLTYKFFIYSLLSSGVLMLAIVLIYREAGTTDLEIVLSHPFPAEMQFWLWGLLFAAFAVRTPIWPLHGWLPELNASMPLTGSVMMSGVIIKTGGYGFLRFLLPIAPTANQELAPVAVGLAIITIFYASLVALVQSDARRRIAYVSILQMGIVTAAIFTTDVEAMEGAIILMLAHGVACGALFFCISVFDRRIFFGETREFNGLAKTMPHLATFFVIFILAFVGIPGTSGFVGQFLVVLGTFKSHTGIALATSIGFALGTILLLFVFLQMFMGKAEDPRSGAAKVRDVGLKEGVVLLPLVALVLWIGIFPSSFLNPMHASIERLGIEYLMRAPAFLDAVVQE